MEICRACWCCISICECGDEAMPEEAVHCENCGTICPADEVDRGGFCDEDECKEASEEYESVVIPAILELASRKD